MRRLTIWCFALSLVAALGGVRAAAQDAGGVQVGEAVPAPPVTATYAGVPIKDVFAALEKSYKSAGIDITERDPIHMRVGNPSFAAQKKIKNVKLENAFDCGGDKKSPAAAIAELMLDIRSELAQVDDAIQVKTYVIANGTIVTSTGRVIVKCTSLGTLERRLTPAPAAVGVIRSQFQTMVITGRGPPP